MRIARRIGNILAAYSRRAQAPYTNNAASFEAERPKKPRISKKEFFEHVARKGRRSVVDINRELAVLSLGPGKLTFDEYVKYRLYEPDQFTLEEKKRFLSENIHWRVVSKVCNPIYDALTQDKFITCNLLQSFGMPTPKTRAIISTTPRLFPGLQKLRTTEDLLECIRKLPNSVFIKPNVGIGSVAAFICDGLAGEDILTRPFGRKTASEVIAMSRDRDFLMQDLIANHPDLDTITTALSTVRLTNFLVNGRVHTPLAVMKLTSEDNIADNFWREGNMLAAVEMLSGRITRVTRGYGIETEFLTSAPKSGCPLIGFAVPYWKEVLELNEKCAMALAPIPFNSLDIAITGGGPVIIEVNTGGSFELPQLANGKGIMTPEVRELFKL